MRREGGHRLRPRPDHGGAGLHELLVPGLEAGGRPPAVPLLQQSVALPQRPVVGRGAAPSRPQRHERLVHEPPPVDGLAPASTSGRRAEEHPAHLPAEIAAVPDRVAVHLHAARALLADLDLHEHLAVARVDLAADVPAVGALAHERLGSPTRGLRRARTGSTCPPSGSSCPRRWARPRRRVPPARDRAGCARGCGSRAARPSSDACARQGATLRQSPTGDRRGSRTGITRYVNSSPSPRTTPGFRPSRTSSRTASPTAAVSPSARYCGLNATVRSSPSYRASTVSTACPRSGRARRELHAERVELEPHRRGVAGEQPDAAHRVQQLLARDRQAALVGLGQELPVVRELALDQPRRERQAARPGTRPATRRRTARSRPSRRPPPRDPPRSARAPARSPSPRRPAVATSSRTARRYESVATSITPSRLTSSSTPVSTGRASSRLAARPTWDTASANAAGLDLRPASARLLQPREVLGRQQPQRALVGRAAHPRLALVGLELDGRVRQRLHRVADQPRRHQRHAGLADLHLDRQPGRHLEVGRRERQLAVLGRLHADAGQRRDPRAGRDPPLDGLQRLGERVSIAPELHRAHPLSLNCSFS